MKKLTLLQNLFVDEYLGGKFKGNAAKSARAAGYKGNDNTLKSVGSELLGKPHIAEKIDKITAKGARRAEATVESVLRHLEETREKALKVGNYGAATRCLELTGKHLKMFTERIEHVATLDSVSDKDLIDLIREIAEAGNVDLSQLLEGDGADSGDLPDPAEPTTTH